MSKVLYGFFGEDRGQRAFLAAYLMHCGSAMPFEAVPYFGKAFGPMNNKVVDRRCGDACQEAFVLGYPKLDWLFVGRDVDSYEPARSEYLLEVLRASIPDKWQNRTLIMLPVQCIEHWLLYLAQHPSRDTLERTPNDQAKDAVYAEQKSRADILSELLATLSPERINWLAGVSISFRDFHTHVQDYLSKLPAPPQP